jgi:ankyrin repeat protein
MAASSDDLTAVLVGYIDEIQAVDRLRELLKSTSVDVRYNLLLTVRGEEYSRTAVHRAAVSNDMESLKYMLAEFTPAQIYELVSIQSSYSQTAVHYASDRGHTDIVIYLLINLSHQQRFHILKVQETRAKQTALHRAARQNHMNLLQIMLSSVTPQQRNELLNIKDRGGKTIANIRKLPELHYASAVFTNQGNALSISYIT